MKSDREVTCCIEVKSEQLSTATFFHVEQQPKATAAKVTHTHSETVESC
jgi:hypothetical protein